MMRRLLIAVLLLTAPVALAEVAGNKGISVTSTSATTTFTNAVSELTVINDTASANELYARVFWCGEASAAATTSGPIRLEPGEFVNLKHNPRTETGIGYCAVSYVTAAAETATMRLVAK
ncbi:MAG TPA: hypothetical protein VJ735_20295 [Actinomycetes bacterium]|nr:hypothetical protein [Actinomycetes bacterium]